jgi:CRP-like cAMP-binding protein
MSHLIASDRFFPRLSSRECDLLSSHGWLSTRGPAFRAALMSVAAPRSFAAGQALYRQGDPANGLFGILDGMVKITIPADDGQDFECHRGAAGFWIGDLAIMAGQKRLVSVVAAEPVRAAFVPASRAQDLINATPAFVQDFYALSFENMNTALRILANLAVVQTDNRLALRLLHLDETASDANGWVALSQADLASMVAVSQPTLRRALHRLAEAGLVEIGYGRLRVADRRSLIAQCQS